MNVLLSVAPVFLLIVLGALLKRTVVQNTRFWDLNNQMVYWLFMPAMLFYRMASTEISLNALSHYVAVVSFAFFVVLTLSLLVSFVLGFDAKVATSILQGAVRHNAFIALAIVSNIAGDQGLILASLLMAILIPITNIGVISVMVFLLRNNKEKNIIFDTLKALLTNPIFLSIVVGILFSLLGFKEVPVLYDISKLLGTVALPLMLLTIGASIKFKHFSGKKMPIFVATLIKMLIFPVVVFFIAGYLALTPMQTTVAVIFGAVPTAVSSFALAKQMGGDAQLMNVIITMQTLVSFISIPLIIQVLN